MPSTQSRSDAVERAVPEVLAASRRLVEPALRAAVEGLSSEAIRHVAAYHFGWRAADGSPVDGAAGKYLRPALTLLAAQAVRADPARAVPGAVAIELVHNFSLLHDDLMDNDGERHHRPTVWKLFGPAKAILAGDALLALAEQVLGEVDGPTARRVTACVNHATQELIRGQVDDLAFEDRLDVTLDEVLAMVGGKTAALMGCATAAGGLAGGGDDEAVAALHDYGVHIGMAFQLVDDLLGIWGRPEVTGKPVLADLRVRKKSVPVVYALRAGGHSSERLAGLLAAESWHDDEELVLAAKLVDDAGGRDWTSAEATRHLALAAASLDRVELAPGPRAELDALARFVTDRER